MCVGPINEVVKLKASNAIKISSTTVTPPTMNTFSKWKIGFSFLIYLQNRSDFSTNFVAKAFTSLAQMDTKRILRFQCICSKYLYLCWQYKTVYTIIIIIIIITIIICTCVSEKLYSEKKPNRKKTPKKR